MKHKEVDLYPHSQTGRINIVKCPCCTIFLQKQCSLYQNTNSILCESIGNNSKMQTKDNYRAIAILIRRIMLALIFIIKNCNQKFSTSTQADTYQFSILRRIEGLEINTCTYSPLFFESNVITQNRAWIIFSTNVVEKTG